MFETPTATGAFFEELEGEPWPLRVHVSGTGYVRRAVQVAAVVGEVVVEQIIPAAGGDGFTGMLAAVPAEGDVLKVGWADDELVDTPVVFHAAGNG
ncbi:hypothetical protein F4556_007322 [Kitasatospora gansuensis]|uniref:Uncharacterized protein n=1 Tax=Kitasatospora gansuensis TaxID=258050 RepID=A0A7W7SKJ1_9ACTN|nr:hypothetical protein [Kitasatospora gansuensis]MBB4951787.1 hypothetical protein [Kitasatospora gansuensis]